MIPTLRLYQLWYNSAAIPMRALEYCFWIGEFVDVCFGFGQTINLGIRFWVFVLRVNYVNWGFHLLVYFQLKIDLTHCLSFSVLSVVQHQQRPFHFCFFLWKKSSLLLLGIFCFTRVLDWVSCVFHCKRVVGFGFSYSLLEGIILGSFAVNYVFAVLKIFIF